MKRKILKILGVAAVVILVVALLAGGWFYLHLRSSLAQLDGEAPLEGLSASARVERDELGTATITAADRMDLARALGYVHAQERFFQMDLLRRRSAGELSGLLGRPTLGIDKAVRIHQFRIRARRGLDNGPGHDLALMQAYSEGVNAGLQALDSPPFEYLLLGVDPSPWRPEDSSLVVYSMYLTLQDSSGRLERSLGVLYDKLPQEMAEFLAPPGSSWDAPVQEGELQLPPLPGPEVFDLRDPQSRDGRAGGSKRPASSAGAFSSSTGKGARVANPPSPTPGARPEDETAIPVDSVLDAASAAPAGPSSGGGRSPTRLADQNASWIDRDAEPVCPPPIRSTCLQALGHDIGSNNWAVAGSRTAHGVSIVANDMHLGLDVPNIWYRARLISQQEGLDLIGVTLPGTPGLVAGSNTYIAWGFTNSYGDWSDVVILEEDAEDTYRTPQGRRRYQREVERIEFPDGSAEEIEVLKTIWGPVIGRDPQGRRLALRWVAHDPQGVNLGAVLLERARNVEEALQAAARAGIPAQNLVVGDRQGRIAWTVMGPIPRRFGHDGRRPSSWADGTCGWDGYLDFAERPRIVDPSGGQLWTANARVTYGADLALLGNGGYANGARAGQIRDGLSALKQATEKDMLPVHLDDRALFLRRWRDLLLDELTPEGVAADSRRLHLREALDEWGERASVDSVGYRMAREFHNELRRQVFETLSAPLREGGVADPGFNLLRTSRQSEYVLWTLVSQRPNHLLNPEFADWSQQILAAADVLLDRYMEDGTLDDDTWGAYNRVVVDHPVSRFIPVIGPWLLDMPRQTLPGATDMPRVQMPYFGASERFAVAPGREQDGYFHMPSAQSGHPLSPFYGNGHQAWAQGLPTPFLPGPTLHTLTLQP
ncbi:MAG TPA: penicillin acylase family protein [Acidobacteriota bacterium]|nr:penicillin acylase family protein [Acidobacteriota bacterium]